MSKEKKTAPRAGHKKILLICILCAVGVVLAVVLAVVISAVMRKGDHIEPIPASEEEKTPVATVGSREILYDELRYVTLSVKAQMQSEYGVGIWDTQESAERYREELTSTVLSVLGNNQIILLCCDEAGIDTSSEDLLDRVQTLVEETVTDCGSFSKYKADLASGNLTDRLLRETLLAEEARDDLLAHYISLGTISLPDGNYPFFGEVGVADSLTAFHDGYLTKDGNTVPVDYFYIQNDKGESPEDNRALAVSLRDRLLSVSQSSREAELGKILGTVTACENTGVGPYFIVRGTYAPAFWDGVKDLGHVGDVSEVIETESGYYVAVRVAYDKDSLSEKTADLYDDYTASLISTLISRKAESVTVEWNAYGKTLDLLKIK